MKTQQLHSLHKNLLYFLNFPMWLLHISASLWGSSQM